VDGRRIWEELLAKRNEWAKQQPSLGAEVRAMAREAVKDIRGTIHETFFGKPEHAPEMGTPLNPTPQMTTQDLCTVHGSYQAILDTYAQRGREAQDHEMERSRSR
jgi:hypothetical protein